MLPQAVAGYFPDVAAVNRNGAFIHVVEPHEQVDKRRLAAAGGTDNGDTLAVSDIQVEMLDQADLRHIREGDVLQ